MLNKITIIVSCAILVLVSGCVSKNKYAKLENKHNSTQSQMKEDQEALFAVKAQNKKLLSENQRLRKEIDDLKLAMHKEKIDDAQTEKIISNTVPSTGEEAHPYSILLSSCQQQESVEIVLSQYREKNLAPFVVKVDLGDKGIWWRIFSGHFETRANAIVEKNQSGFADKIVLKATDANLMLTHDGQNEEELDDKSLLVKKVY